MHVKKGTHIAKVKTKSITMPASMQQHAVFECVGLGKGVSGSGKLILLNKNHL